MSVLTHSRDIFMSTNQSGRVGAGESQFSRFRMGLNTSPLTCGAGEMTKLSLTQFSCFRNFYYINQYNNLVVLSYIKSGTQYDEFIQLTPGDYDTIEDIAKELTDRLVEHFAAAPISVNFSPNNTQKPAANDSPSLRKYGVTLSAAGHGITALGIQTRQYGANTLFGGSTQFGDSYCILGSKRIGAADATANSFAITYPSVDTISIAGFYPMQTTSMAFMYMRCSEVADNIESQNLSTDGSVQDSHMVASHILAKIPVDDVVCALQYETSPYFLNSNNRHISELRFHLIDHHGREIPLMDPNIELDGNLFSNATFKVETFAIGGNEHTLNTPVRTFNYEGNTIKQIHGIVG